MSETVIKNWLALAEYDYETAKAMFQSGRYMYVAFTCQQAVEKVLKAIYVKEHKKTPPYVHNLVRLAQEAACFQELPESMLSDMEVLNSYYLQSRYSDQLSEMMAQFTKERAKEFLQKTDGLMQWLKHKL
jgi:HEPN domain-containing protein